MRARALVGYGFAIALLVQPVAAHAAEPRLFDSHDPLTLDLEADWFAIQRDRKETPTPRPAKLSYAGPAGPVSLQIQIETRGRSRLRETVCDFPPLLLDIPKEGRKGTLLRGIGELKLVTHCQRAPAYEQNLVLEYLIYRTYNLLSDDSYRVRMLQVRYFDPGKAKPRIERAGFVIEDVSELAKRIGAERIKEGTVDPAQIDPAAAARVELFLYMIGMTDFSLSARHDGPCCHNVRMLRREGRPLVPVPYDFDQTGVVDPEYALPDPRLKISGVTERRFRGYCRPAEQHSAAIAELRAKRAEITALFESEAKLAPARRKKALKFLDGFYAWADQPARVQKVLSEECRAGGS
jgi:hypothetical protein